MRSSPYRWYIGSVLFGVFGALLYVWCHVTTLSQGERIAALREAREALVRRQDVLEVRAAGLQKASRIREIAAIELGMRFPEGRPNNLYTGPAGLKGRSVPLEHTASVDAGR